MYGDDGSSDVEAVDEVYRAFGAESGLGSGDPRDPVGRIALSSLLASRGQLCMIAREMYDVPRVRKG